MRETEKGRTIPKYVQIKQFILNQIERGDLVPGQALPPERVMAERYGVSRLTARQSLMELVNEGMLYRRQGHGTFVAEPKLRQEAVRLASFTEEMRERGMEASSTVLDLEVDDADPPTAKYLQTEVGAKVIRMRRVRYADGEPMALERSHLLYEQAKRILGTDLANHSLYESLARIGVVGVRADQSYEATLVTEEEVEHLGVAAGSPALLIERVTFNERDQPFEYVKSVYRGDRYRVTSTLTP